MKKIFAVLTFVATGLASTAYSEPIGKGLYVGGSLNLSKNDISTSGFNTLGGFGNADCEPSIISAAGLECGKGDTLLGGSVFVGKNAVLSYGEKSSIRVEAELSYASDSDFVTASFPGPPSPTFFYQTQVSNLKTVFLNAYYDHATSKKLSFFASTGVGLSNYKVTTSDGVVGGSDSSTNFSYNFGLGTRYRLTDSVDIFGQIRHVYHGKTSVALNALGGGAPAGNYAVRLKTNEVRMGLMVNY